MRKWIGRQLNTIGLKLIVWGFQLQRAQAVATVCNYDNEGTKCVAMTAGDTVNTNFLRAAAGLAPDKPSTVSYVILANGKVVSTANTEPEARAKVGEYHAQKVPTGVYELLDGSVNRYTSLLPDEQYDPTVPLFPLEASAA